MSDKSIIGLALAPTVVYVTFVMWCLLAGVSVPGGTAMLAGGGFFVAAMSVGLANVVRLRRDGPAHVRCTDRRRVSST